MARIFFFGQYCLLLYINIIYLLLRALGIPLCAQLERFIYNAQDLFMSLCTPRTMKKGWEIAGVRPSDLDKIMSKWTLYRKQTKVQSAAIKAAILGPLLSYWQTDGYGDIPDKVICDALQDLVPDLYIRNKLEKRQVSERGCLSLLNDKKLETERKLAADKAAEIIANATARIARADKAQKAKEERQKKETLAKAKIDLLSPEAKIELQEKKAAQQLKRKETSLRKKEEKAALALTTD